MKKNTDKQQAILEAIHEFQQKNSYPPTLQELADQFGFKSKNSITKHLSALASKGYLKKENASARGLKIIDHSTLAQGEESVTIKRIPLLGRIAAGAPILAQEYVDQYLTIPEYLVKAGHQYFALRVRGESMMMAGIKHADIVIVQSQQTARENEIVVALIDEEATVKRLKISDTGYYLKAENPDFRDIYPLGSWSIQGIVVGLIRDQI